ncbi:autotransporter secretion inner membrane protein TamB [Rhodobacter sp. JA431]|uniref:translocation/assembly module TamB domain-containing protein n=1 Tax=Rhodobacter sp. JA431 TaxID=570013 RepID=UPI000BCF02B2|nr:translocation/assembly module TamB domain-containing protein [Rhodobacter sp. JA431]SOC07994.1 autotransporter secretion inner membrane protein TamB [Rhodobacter sp. JA431]
MRFLALLIVLFLPFQALAQDDQTERDRSYLTGLIEDNLSGAGRSIRLEGFAGALSSRATFDSLTIADDTGVWITVKNGALQWDRAAILRGEILIDELSAESIDLPRLPQSEPDPTAPEATPFALPDLPVTVQIGKINAQKVTLGAPVLGQAVALKLSGSMRLAGGAGETKLEVARIDGPKGQLSLAASYANDTHATLVDLLVSEGADGIAATLMNLPGKPALSLSLSGLGPIETFAADVALSTAGQKRLSGKIALTSTEVAGETERGFDVALAGDVSPLLPPEYQDFFGKDAKLEAAGSRTATGMMQLRKLTLNGAAVQVTGSVDLLPTGLPDRFDLQAKVGLEGEAVLLPLSGPETRLRTATLALGYNRAQGDGWKLQGDITGFTRGTAEAEDVIDRINLSGSGRIGQPVEGSATAGGTLNFGATGIALSDPALAEALGAFATGALRFFWQEGKPLNLPQIRLTTRDFEATGRLSLNEGVVSAVIRADHKHLQSLSQLAGRALSGSISAQISGDYTVLSGAFDADAAITAPDLRLSQPQADALLAGGATITASARRDETGLSLRSLVAKSDALSLNAEGRLTSAANDLTATLDLRDLGKLGGGYNGAANAKLVLQGPLGARKITLSGQGVNLSLAQAQLNRILAGQSRFSVAVDEGERGFRLANLDINTSQLTASATARAGNESLLDIALKLSNAALLAPGFPGPVTLSGSLDQREDSYGLDLRGTGPGGTEATVKGSVASDFSTTDLSITGRTESALLNGLIEPRSVQGPLTFDLALQGAPGLSALSGQLRGQGLRLSLPTLGQALQNVTLQAQLAGGSASLSGQAEFEGGGTLRVSGPVQLASPFPSDLSLVLDRAHLRDPQLYDTRLSGNLNVNGGLTGNLRISGALSLAETELRIPSSGLGGAAAIPEVTHLHEPADVRQTRTRAGLIDTGGGESSGPGRIIALDVSVSAPNQIFVRGRGLDAELGGQLRVTGTTANILPVGEFNLIRGRLDVLGKRFTLAEGQVALQGALTPWVKFAATTDQDDTAITLTLEGAASEPGLSIASSPELPEEEVLARLLFDKGLTNLSALQAAQLATAVATLAGKGGEGIVSKLRKGFGLDDLDVGTDASGNATVRAGKYISENVYSDVSVDSNGQAEVTLNLDITKQLTARGSVGSDGASALGLFFEKDY